MNKSHWTNPELSKKLEDLGVVSEFDYWQVYDESTTLQVNSGNDGKPVEFVNKTMPEKVPRYHFSDLLFPENAKKVWTPEKELKIRQNGGDSFKAMAGFMVHELYTRFYDGHDWQEWLSNELKKR